METLIIMDLRIFASSSWFGNGAISVYNAQLFAGRKLFCHKGRFFQLVWETILIKKDYLSL